LTTSIESTIISAEQALTVTEASEGRPNLEIARPPARGRWLGMSLALVAVLVVIDRVALPQTQVQRWSDLLQLLLSLGAGALCVYAAARERALGRAFWVLIGLGTLIWAAGQAVWTLESVALHPFATISLSDLLFLACSTPFMIVALVRPDRPASGNLGLAYDASLLLALLLHADAYFVLGELVAGNAEEFQVWQTRLLGLRGAVVLVVFWWLIRSSRSPWRRVFEQIGVAFVLLYGVGAGANLLLAQGLYRPGLQDLVWTIPFLWIGLSAADATPDVAPTSPSAVAVPEWDDTRRGTVLALLAVILVPALHFVSTSFVSPNATLERLRGTLTLATTVIVGGLFLLRQLHLLRRVEEAQVEREASLRSSEERFEKAFRASPAAMSISTFRERRLLDVNDRFAALTGFGREELIGRTVTDLGLWVDAEEHEALVRSVREGGSPRDAELQYRRKSGEIRTVLTSYVLVEVGGEACLLGLSEDVSDRRFLEAQLRQAQKMEAVGRLAGGIAHDFNNLLTAILGYAGLMLRRLRPGDPLLHEAQEVRKAGERAADLTRQLLAFSRKQVLVPQVVDLGLVVAEIESMLRRVIGEDIELVTRTEAGLWVARVDAGQVGQVILNLAVNARDAMPGGGRLTIALQNVEVDEAFIREHPGAKPGSYVMLRVTDTGVGMSPETQSHVFEPFFTTKEIGKGTGLGLATVYGIVKQSDGYVAVRSGLGLGSTFAVYLPRVAGVARPREPERMMNETRGSETVLLVEDEEAVRRLVREILESAGYAVLDAASGAEAIERSHDHPGPIHLMMTDVVMPGMSGPQLANQITAARPGIRVLYTSGYPDDALGSLGALRPGTAFLQKPVTPDELADRVRQVLDGPAPGPTGPVEPA
jgi:two-component system, cell cycle sensor histidine kinase and response regulator CckA